VTPKAKQPPLVIELCRALVETASDRPVCYWFNIDKIRATLDVPMAELDVAVAWAVEHQLVRVDSLPNPHSISPTYEGLTLSSRLERASRKRRPPSRGK
jgi:hypothetical protein